ncbi:MAG TPA: ABC transporter ATP-binding protein [Halanaerobiales bacterium]|nr:ABC transporter ATP-binding protein [Halanaerobiales bacterium]
MDKYTYLSFFKKYKGRYILGVIWLIIVDGLQLIIPKLLGNITDKIKYDLLDTTGLIKYAGLIIILALGTAIFRFLWRYFIFGTGRLIEKNIREDFYNKLQSLSTRYFNDHKTGDLMAHATNDINAVRMAMGPGIVMIADAVFLTTATIGILIFTIDIRLTLLALIPLPFLSLMAVKFGKIIHSKYKKVQKSFSNMSDKAQENFAGIRVVKAFAQEKEEIDKFAESNRENYEKNVDMFKYSSLFHPLVQFISALSFLIVIGYGGILVIRGTISLGDFVAFNSYLGMLTWPMMALGLVINHLQRGQASLDRLNVIFNEKEDIFDQNIDENIKEIKGKIEIKDLDFKYSDSEEYALKNINLNINPGETAAFIGRTGSGKTTLVNLLLRLYNVEEEKIFIDGNDINDIPLAVVRENIGYVPQDNFLFSNTINKNIAFANPTNMSQDEIIKASKDAQVYENIIEFPDKFKSLLGERGSNVSGGQKQRISIARALIKNPKILILDDSLSAVDTQTEERILESLEEIMKGKTSILISHRISTIKNADKIFVFDEGKLIEKGNHEDLLKNEKLYYDLYQKQQLEEKIANS